MPVTLRQLEIFITVAETQQVTRASKKLFLTQSAVSMALGELENQLSGSLFDRHGRRLLLNDRGRYLLPMARKIIFQVWNVESLLTEEKNTIAGSLEIVASSTIGNYILPYLIGLFMRIHQDIRINMLVTNSRQAEKMVAEGTMDLGFVEGNISVDDELVKAEPWFRDELRIIVSPSHPLAEQKTFKMPADLEKTTWVIREEGSGIAQIFKKRLGKDASLLKTVTRLGHTEAIKKAVETGEGAACVPQLTVSRETQQGWLKSLAIEGLDMHRQLHIILHKEKVLTRLMNEFLSFCQVLTRCELGLRCLNSPWKLQNILSEHNEQKLGTCETCRQDGRVSCRIFKKHNVRFHLLSPELPETLGKKSDV